MRKYFYYGLLLLTLCTEANAETVTAYNSFSPTPIHSDQSPGFGYTGGMQGTSSFIGSSFVPTASGNLAELWIGVGTSLGNPGTDTFDLYLTTSAPDLSPETILAHAQIHGALANRESIIDLPTDPNTNIFLEKDVMYWLILATSPGTEQVAFLGSGTEVPGSHLAYLGDKYSSGWYVTQYANDTALRVDVTAVPETDTYAMLLAGLGVLGFVARRKQK